ncbi:CBS domain-containing protein [Planococcus sp. CP5-4]|uniref:CBS domain-containing protein n=1 Tax=unclassified Planococcus (in: firmicutes) TaxID=2662419 RepID=UPI001C21C337|nr:MULTISPECIES: CBS domain-containing protein [unclassified Planococcus (in: firmicutes)]MBU9673241.1 CBS domain-containing protein [Planococcus sp. CP5-4_YE]MBW6062549.1 CBS domain-containing protein [Planococcus sp. CP5-4]
MKIAEIMTTDVETCLPTVTIQDIAAKMREINVGSIPICEEGRIVGIVTDRDIVLRGIAEELEMNAPIAEIFSETLITGTEEMLVGEAALLMARHQIRRLPIVRKEQVVGIVSLGDIALRSKTPGEAETALEKVSGPAKPRR